MSVDLVSDGYKIYVMLLVIGCMVHLDHGAGSVLPGGASLMSDLVILTELRWSFFLGD
jgi:hypothetical protein